MSEPIVIHVKPVVRGNIVKTEWGVFLNDEAVPIGRSKSHCDCDLFANVIARYYENAIVDHHPELVENPWARS